jgi:hypothetical protein
VIVGVNAVISNPADKQKLHALTGAVAVDMESHLVARLAASYDLAFAAVRVVIDPAHRAVPPANWLFGHGATLAFALRSLNSMTQETPLDGDCVRQKRAAAVNTRQNEKRTHMPRSRILTECALAGLFVLSRISFPRRILQ